MHDVATSDVRKSIKPFLVAWLVAAAFYVVVANTAGRNISPYLDFRAFYSAGALVRTDPAALFDLNVQQALQNTIAPGPVLPFNHPAYEALLFAPFSVLPYRGAYVAFAVFNLLLVLGAFLAARDAFSVTLPLWQPRPGLMLFPFVPLIAALFHGQDSVLSLFLCCLAWRFLTRDQIALSGFILSLGLFKFNLFLPLVLVLVVWKGWKLAAGFAVGAAAVVVCSLALVGLAGTASFFALLRSGSLLTAHDAATQNTFATFPMAMGNLYGLVYALGHLKPGPATLTAVASALSLVVLFLACRAARRQSEDRVVFSVAILSALLVSHHLNLHDLTLLLLPLALLYDRPGHSAWALVCFAMPPVLLLFFGSNAFFLLSLPVLAAFLELSLLQHRRLLPVRLRALAKP
jgi:hypothetical protein